MKKHSYRPFTPEEIEFIKQHYPRLGPREVARRLNRTPGTVRTKARKLGVKMLKSALWKLPKLNLTPEERAYIAGVIDCDGSILVMLRQKPNGRWHVLPAVKISNLSKNLIEFMVEKAGARNYHYRRYRTKRGEFKIVYEAQWSGSRAYPLLKAIKEYLIVKRRQCELMIELLEEKGSRPVKSGPSPKEIHLAKEIRALNSHYKNEKNLKLISTD